MMIRSLLACSALVLSFVALLAMFSRSALAQTAEASCAAVEQTEAMRAEGHYRKARARLLECVNAQCGGDVRRRCAATLQKLDGITPSIVVRAEDERGNDVTDVAVILGDEPLVNALDGLAIPVDPGVHRFEFRRPGYSPVIQTITIQQGEKFRSVDVQIGPPPAPTPIPLESERPNGMSTTRLAGGASLIGVGVAGLVGFTWIGAKARSGEEDLRRCVPCSQARIDGVRKRYLLANISGAVGLVALGAATWLLLSAPSSPDIAQPADGLAVGADAHGAFAAFSGTF